MTTLLFINCLFLVCLAFTIFYLFYKQRQTELPLVFNKPQNDNLNQITNLDWKVKGLLFVALILIIISFLAPFVFTREAIKSNLNFSQTGAIGDTIGGLMNPFITLSGVMITGLAFYIQYRANLLQRELFIQEQTENKKQLQEQIDNQNKQIRLQQFESQFYEMLKLHRDNITETKINGYDFEEVNNSLKRFEKITEGRKVFVLMKTEFEIILSLFSKINTLDEVGFKKCYKLFFSGVDAYEKSYPDEILFVEMLKKARRRHQYPERNGIKTNKDRKEFLPYAKLYFNYKPFSGHAQRLGHYFRHLYLIVKSIVNSEIVIEYDERMKYLRILRAQLSNHEQILLFYNWISGYGLDWENGSNKFFTEYCMIHNLWYNDLFDNKYISENVNYLRTKEVVFRKGNMFEIDSD